MHTYIYIHIYVSLYILTVFSVGYRSNNAPRPKPGSINGDLPSPHSTANSNLLAITPTDANNSDVHVDEASNPNVSTTDDNNNGDVGRDGLNGNVNGDVPIQQIVTSVTQFVMSNYKCRHINILKQ